MSYRLTLIFESAQEMADVINDIALNHRELDVSVQVNEFINPRVPDALQRQADAMSDDEVAVRERIWGDKPESLRRADAKAKIAHSRVKADRARAERDAKAKDRFTREMAQRRHGLALDAIGSLNCPECFATKGHACSGSNGEPRKGYAHPYRIRAMLDGKTTEQMAHELSVKYANAAEVHRTNAKVACPSCRAAKGERCITAGGHKLSHYAHKARIELAQPVML